MKHVLKNNQNHADKLLTGTELDRVSELFKVLAPFKQLSEVMSGSSYPTASLILPSVHKISDYLQNYETDCSFTYLL